MIENRSYVTDHAQKRIKERLGINKKSIQKVSDKALSLGLKHSETTGRLKKYADSLYLKKKRGFNIRIYSEKVYLFANETLVTVLPLPTDLKKIANKLLQTKKESKLSL